MNGVARLLIALVGRLLPSAGREFVLGDIEERFRDRLRRGPVAAYAWLAWQLPQALRHRWRPGAANDDRRRYGVGALRRDLGFAWRSLTGAPALALTAIATLALGIGANTAIYTLLDHALLRPLPFPEADRLVRVYNFQTEGPDRWNLSFPDYEDLSASAPSLEGLAAWREETPAMVVGDDSRATRVRVSAVTANLPPMLGMEPLAGRLFLAEEDQFDRPEGAALLSWGLARDRFGDAQAAVGAEIRLDERLYHVVGVLPERFGRGAGGGLLPAWETDVWVAYRSSMAAEGSEIRGLTNVAVMGMLAPGATIAGAEAEAGRLAEALAEEFPDIRENAYLGVRRAQEVIRSGPRSTLWLLYGAVSLVLLIAGTNVAHLLLGRNVARGREIAVRMALGAGRTGVMRQVLGESLLLALAGAVVGWGVGWGLLEIFGSSQLLALPGTPDPGLDLRVLGGTAAIAVLVGVIFGALPAWQATRRDPAFALRQDDRTTSGSGFMRRGLAVAETALAVTLLIAAALTLQSLDRVLNADPGFEPEGILTARLQLPIEFVDRDWPRAVALFAGLEERLSVLPGVRSAAAAYMLPVEAGWNNSFELPPEITPPGLDSGPSARFRPVTPRYFETAGIPLVQGRLFTAADTSGGPGVVIVNRAFVRRFLGDAPPLGVQLSPSNWWRAFEGTAEIVGVVEDVRFDGRTAPTEPAIYFPHAQQPVREMSLLVATEGDPAALVGAIRDEVERLEPGLPLDAVATLEERLATVDAGRASLARLLTAFALLALVLAGIGVYGVMSFLVVQRTREIGIRMALGAGVGQVRGLVLREGGALLLLGLVAGGAGAVIVSGYLGSLLYEVDRTDPVAFVGSAAFLCAVGLLACWLPALRATRVDPMLSLRGD